MIKNFLSFFKSKKRIIFVESLDDQNSFIEKIKNQNILGLDTEFDWRSTYLPVLSLLQISTSKNIFIVDFLSFKNNSVLIIPSIVSTFLSSVFPIVIRQEQ